MTLTRAVAVDVVVVIVAVDYLEKALSMREDYPQI